MALTQGQHLAVQTTGTHAPSFLVGHRLAADAPAPGVDGNGGAYRAVRQVAQP